MIVNSETLARLRKRTCSPEPSHLICRKYQQAINEISWYQFIGGTAQDDIFSGSIGNKIKQSICLSLHGSVFDFCNDRTEYLRRIGDIGV